MPRVKRTKLSIPRGTLLVKGKLLCQDYFFVQTDVFFRYKEAGEALRRKQDKEREAAGLPPVQRVGARGAAPAQRGQQRGGPPARGGGRGAPVPQRGGRGGGAPGRTMHTAADKNLYVHLLGHLRKKALLPVVVFTFSKKRCEENAASLTNADLCTSVEKSEVHVAIEKALTRLKGRPESHFFDFFP